MQKTFFAFKDSYFFRTAHFRGTIFYQHLLHLVPPPRHTRPPPPKPLPQYSAHSDTQSAHPGTKKERTDIRFSLFRHNRQLILHIVIIVGAHISGLVRQLIGTLYLIIAVIVVVVGAVVGRIVYFDVYLD